MVIIAMPGSRNEQRKMDFSSTHEKGSYRDLIPYNLFENSIRLIKLLPGKTQRKQSSICRLWTFFRELPKQNVLNTRDGISLNLLMSKCHSTFPS